jgi:hypothetical protein
MNCAPDATRLTLWQTINFQLPARFSKATINRSNAADRFFYLAFEIGSVI